MTAFIAGTRATLRRQPFIRRNATLREYASMNSGPAGSGGAIFVCDCNSQSQVSWSSAALMAAVAATATTFFAAGSTVALSEGSATTDEDRTKILNWSGTHSVELAQGDYHEPETMDELVQLVSRAYREGRHIRPVGSALSPNGLAFDSRGMVGLSNLDRILKIDKEGLTVTVEAGARVSQVLDALRPHGLTLPNLASIAEQQIGGFVSVGAHGTGAAVSTCDEFVEALTIVTPSQFGVVKMTEQSHGPLFRLARLGLGGLGILSEVTLKVVPAHRLVEQTIVMTRLEAKEQLSTLLKRHKHVRYMWIPYEDAVVVVTNDPENELPLRGPGTEVDDGNGGKKKVVTADDIKPKYSRDEQLGPLQGLLGKILKNKQDTTLDEDAINGMGFGDLRDVILASGNMLDPDHIKRCNKAEREFWVKAQGVEIAPSDQKLQFDCGGQQWVYEVCFPVGTYGFPNSNSMGFVEELLNEIETTGIAAPSPIEQRWTKGSQSPLSPASVGPQEHETYESQNALFSWVGVIMYLPSEDFDPTGFRREFITQSFKDEYCKLVRKVGQKYGIMCHWAKLEVSDEDDPSVAESVRARFGPKVVNEFNAARDLYDPKGLLSCPLLEKVFGTSSDN
ncbi:hypothetical protein ACHAWF_008971 [Thalassiosira exigua]